MEGLNSNDYSYWPWYNNIRRIGTHLSVLFMLIINIKMKRDQFFNGLLCCTKGVFYAVAKRGLNGKEVKCVLKPKTLELWFALCI